jgi:hypothetical protein
LAFITQVIAIEKITVVDECPASLIHLHAQTVLKNAPLRFHLSINIQVAVPLDIAAFHDLIPVSRFVEIDRGIL